MSHVQNVVKNLSEIKSCLFTACGRQNEVRKTFRLVCTRESIHLIHLSERVIYDSSLIPLILLTRYKRQHISSDLIWSKVTFQTEFQLCFDFFFTSLTLCWFYVINIKKNHFKLLWCPEQHVYHKYHQLPRSVRCTNHGEC